MIEFKNVSKTYKDNGANALSKINLTIEDGEFVFVVGANGSGKSTMIKLLLKEEEVSEGKILWDNTDITALKRREIPMLRRRMGVVFQDYRLLPKKTVYENVAFSLQIIEASGREIRRKVPAVLSLVGLSKLQKAYPHQISGGERQRVALARALVNSPSLLLADEPTGNLDPDHSWEIMQLLNDINQRGTTIIMATHAWDIVDEMQKRVITLKDGVMTRDIEKGGYDNEI